ncbi:MAG: hypothetical protein NVS3B12_24340 [Acidimicrobiales bacterium]
MSEGFDPQALLAQALEMQQHLMDAQSDAAAETVEGTAGSGKVRVTMSGAGEVSAVRIDPSVVDPAEVDMLEDLILAALHDAATKASALAQVGLGGLGDLLSGSGLEGMLGGLFGGGGEGGTGMIDAGATEARSGLSGHPELGHGHPGSASSREEGSGANPSPS